MSQGSLFSAQWHRVRDVCPRLASDVTVSRHVYRGRTAYVLHRRDTADCHRLDVAGFELVDRLDGETSVGQVWDQAIVERDKDAPTQDEWIALLADLHAADLMVVDRHIAEERLFDRRQKHRASERQQRYLNPLYLRFALHDPDQWLTTLTPLAKRLFSRTAGLLWLMLMAVACISAFSQGVRLWDALTDATLLSARTTLLFVLVYPPLKFLHELAHALAVKRAGGEVHETGMALMILLPLPYVDASASALFPDKQDRMLVSAAGILVELSAAAIGLLLWATTDGLLQEIGLVLFMTGGISTLLLNGNPLLKFDGYYLLADWIEIPNLASRSRRTVLDGLRSLLTGKSSRQRRTEDRAEKAWLHAYGIFSATYRTLLMLSIAWVLSDRWFFMGVMLAVLVVILSVVLPLWRAVSALFRDPAYHCRRAVVLAIALPLLLLMMAVWVPVPHTSVVPGVVWIPEEAEIRVSSNCDINDVFVQPGQQVKAGDVLFACEEPELQARLHELVARVDELQVRRAGAAARDPLELGTLDAELQASEAAIQDTRERMAAITQRAGFDGLFDVVGTAALQGRALTRGDVVAFVIPPTTRTVRLAIDERAIARFDEDLQAVQLRIQGPHGRARVFDTAVLRRMPKATRMVSSAALSTYGGGMHEADPAGDGTLLKNAVFDVELAWPQVAEFAAVGSHVGVRLVYAPAPLLERMGTKLRQTLAGRVAS
ncbi:biotin/lipoyl-binding protein [Granulosicoccus sp. 3-233]|uniref:biotin/lipoyl-binding protein n=1 Tax=Granulosicoccus sp. 3-233 TaxID=3417969 RepID=UPI003D3388B3